MNVFFTSRAWNQYHAWQMENPAIAGKINELIDAIRQSPFKGAGKPEPLRHNYVGWWSRRITLEHRLVYRVEGKGPAQQIIILQCRHHYDE
ncbi:MAG: Txe/YoeB family addiction module toxin [Proteobacteria bacterium]|nr:Txe/YoeB family addiction module toxin [Pseudomonadota bacterium]